MGTKKTAELRRLATVTLSAAAVVAVGVIVVIWKLLVTSEESLSGHDVFFLFCAGKLRSGLTVTNRL